MVVNVSKGTGVPRRLPEPGVESLDLSAVLSALADPARREIAARVLHDPTTCNEAGAKMWVDELSLSAPTISHHYRVLREAGITRTTVDGRAKTIVVRADDLEARFPGLVAAVLGSEPAGAAADGPA